MAWRGALVLLVLVAAWPAAAQLAPAGAHSLAALRARCIPLARTTLGPDATAHTAAECRVSTFRAFATLGDAVYYRAIYCLVPHHQAGEPDGACRTLYGSAAVAIFVGDRNGDRARLLLERSSPEPGLLVFDEPAIVSTRYGTILHVKIALAGTGAGNASEYYVLRDGVWHPLDALGWLKTFPIPSGLAVWKGVWPDLATMTARVALYRPTDYNCCPTGGIAVVTLALRDRALVVQSVRREPAGE